MRASKCNHSKIGERVGNAVVIKSGRARLIDPKTGAPEFDTKMPISHFW